MERPSTGSTVVIDFVLKRGDGQEIGGTGESGPQRVTLGTGQIFPHLERALAEMRVGDTRIVSVACDEAFGRRSEKLVMEIPRGEMPPGPAPVPGMTMSAEKANGQTVSLVVLDVGDDIVRVDANHPLAGEDLTFEITLRGIEA